MKRIQARDLSRRAMLCQAAIASGLGGIFTMSVSGQQAGGGAGGRGASVH
jgi:hypothetical protein